MLMLFWVVTSCGLIQALRRNVLPPFSGPFPTADTRNTYKQPPLQLCTCRVTNYSVCREWILVVMQLQREDQLCDTVSHENGVKTCRR
jgi:hypothetical protein